MLFDCVFEIERVTGPTNPMKFEQSRKGHIRARETIVDWAGCGNALDPVNSCPLGAISKYTSLPADAKENSFQVGYRTGLRCALRARTSNADAQ